MDKNDLVKPKDIIIGFTITAVICGLAYGLFVYLFRSYLPATDDLRINYAPYAVVRVYAVRDDPDRPIGRRLYDGYVVDISPFHRWTEYESDALKYNETARLSVIIPSGSTFSVHTIWRTLYRNGESVRVVYVSTTEVRFAMLRIDWTTMNWRSKYIPTSALDDIILPQMVEVYYLRGLHRIEQNSDELSDEAFDALRDDAVLLWRDVIRRAE